MKKLALTLALLLILTCTSAIAEPDTSEDPYGAMSTKNETLDQKDIPLQHA